MISSYLEHVPKKYTWIIGIDEAGRGPLAGPLSVGLVLLQRSDIPEIMNTLPLVQDSKKLSEPKRDLIRTQAYSLEQSGMIQHVVCFTSADDIDAHGISAALKSSIDRGIADIVQSAQIDPKQVFVQLDGSLHAPVSYRQQTIVRGDTKAFAIALASIYAKTQRDEMMYQYDIQYPQYCFAQHKGYGTVDHRKRIKQYGPCPIHRRSFLKNIIDINSIPPQ